MLWYVKGGAAVTHDKYNGIVTATGAPLDQASETRWGGAVGTGVEVGFAPGWSVAVEYDHLFMGSGNNTFTSSPRRWASDPHRQHQQDVDMAPCGSTTRFGGPVVARY